MPTYLAFAIGLGATLALASFLTPRSWWRRPNLCALAVLAGGTWGAGSLLLWFAQAPALAATPPPASIAAAPMPIQQGRSFRVFEDLNLRAASGVDAKRIAVVPTGAVVTTTGLRDGDWWQVGATVGGKPVRGWASSLWLRRADEMRR
ncbi:MAG TPA: SH3 domain-containing protein [Telluria sp.]|nr:SH3 domain-containing protein [Telluria sp.]